MKNFIDNIKEFKKTKNGTPILFFGFYLLFFVVLIIFIKFGGDKNFMAKEYEKGRAIQFNTSLLLNKNYLYDYKIIFDGTVYDYYGKRFQDTESFKYNNSEYYRNNNDFFVNNGTWVKCDNPYLFYELIDVDNMSKVLNSSTLSSKDISEGGVSTYKYLISTNTINKIVYNIDSDFDEVPNDIDIVLDNNSGTNTIKFKLDSFCKVNNKCNESLQIEASYEMFNSVKEIGNPIK